MYIYRQAHINKLTNIYIHTYTWHIHMYTHTNLIIYLAPCAESATNSAFRSCAVIVWLQLSNCGTGHGRLEMDKILALCTIRQKPKSLPMLLLFYFSGPYALSFCSCTTICANRWDLPELAALWAGRATRTNTLVITHRLHSSSFFGAHI